MPAEHANIIYIYICTRIRHSHYVYGHNTRRLSPAAALSLSLYPSPSRIVLRLVYGDWTLTKDTPQRPRRRGRPRADTALAGSSSQQQQQPARRGREASEKRAHPRESLVRRFFFVDRDERSRENVHDAYEGISYTKTACTAARAVQKTRRAAGKDNKR